MKNNTKTQNTMNTAIIAEVCLAAGKRGESVRAFNTINGADITSEITYMTLSKAFKAGCGCLTNPANGARFHLILRI